MSANSQWNPEGIRVLDRRRKAERRHRAWAGAWKVRATAEYREMMAAEELRRQRSEAAKAASRDMGRKPGLLSRLVGRVARSFQRKV